MALDEKATLQAAWQALLRGDTAERDRLLNLVKHNQKQRVRVKEGGPMMPGKPIQLVDRGDGTLVPEKS